MAVLRRIMLVEDEAIIALNQQMILKRNGYEVCLATSGEEAVRKFCEDELLSLVLMDINLGDGIDGTEAARQILTTRDIPLVFLSSHTEPEIVEKTENISSYGYIVKNSGETVLLASIRMAFRLYEARQRELRQEQALAKSEMHFRILADSGQALIWTAGTDKKCDYFNKPWLDFTGSTLEQEVGDGWARHVHPDDMERCVATYVNAFDRREPFSMVYRLQRHDGEYRWIQDDGKPRFDERGIFFGYIGHCLDVTAHRSTQDRLGELKLGLQAAGDGVAVLDSQQNVKYCNESLAAIFGYTVDEITGKSWRMLYSVEQQQHLEEVILPVIPAKGSFCGCFAGTRRDGSSFEQELSLNLLDNGGLVCVVRDISEDVRTEGLLRLHDDRLRFLSAHIKELIATTDRNGRVTWVSDAAVSMFGLAPEDMLGHYFPEYLDMFSSANVVDAFNEVINFGREVSELGLTLRRPDGSLFDAQLWGISFMGGTLVVIRKNETDKALPGSSEKAMLQLFPRYLHPVATVDHPVLSELLDVKMIKTIMDDLYPITGIGVALVDVSGKVLVSTGWQKVCEKFHRAHPASLQKCVESDRSSMQGGVPGEVRARKCPNGLWDLSSPVMVGNEYLGSIFVGQFFYDDENIDLDLFRKQAELYEYDEQGYLEAIAAVPRYSRAKVASVMRLYSGLAMVLSTLGYNNALYVQALQERERAARELRAGEEKFRQLYENMVHGVFYQNADGILVDINPAGLEMFGLTREQFLGRSSHHPEWKVVDEEFQLLEPDNHPTMQCLREEKPVNRIVGVYNPKTADYRWLSVYARPLYHKGEKKPYQIVATMHDITRRKELENRLREMVGVVESMPAVLFVWRYEAPDGLYLAGANNAALASTGLDFEALRDQSFDQVFPEAKAIGITDAYLEVMRTGQSWQGHDTRYADERVRGVFSINAFRISPDRLGVAFEDVSERVRGEDALRASEVKYRILTETMKDVVWVLDVETLCFLYVSPSVKALRGYTPEEIMSKPLDDALTEEQRLMIRELVNERSEALRSGAIDDENFFVEEVAQPCKDGSMVWTEVVTRFWKNPGTGKIEVHGVTRDITERRKNREKIAGLLEEKELLLRETHHRIKNNMSVIHGLLHMQAKRVEQTDSAVVLEDAASRVQSMVVLYDTLYGNDGSEFAEARDFLPRLAADVAALYNGILPVRIVTDVDECRVPVKTMSVLGIIVNELMTNSLKHAFAGVHDPLIHISLHHTDEALEMIFRDNGVGLVSKYIEAGHGFGMQLINMLAEQIGATMLVESDNGMLVQLGLPFKKNNKEKT